MTPNLAEVGSSGPSTSLPSKPTKKPRTPRSHAPRFRAETVALADSYNVGSSKDKDTQSSASLAVTMKRIRSLYARSEADRGCTENEMKNAHRMASRLMEKHNISMADVFAQQANSERPAEAGGHSTVRIFPTNQGAKVCMETWSNILVGAVGDLYDCKRYSIRSFRQNHIVWTFYGIPQHTVCAAEVFEAAYNIAWEWAMQVKKGNKNSYLLGVAKGVEALVDEERMASERHAKLKSGDGVSAGNVNNDQTPTLPRLEIDDGTARPVDLSPKDPTDSGDEDSSIFSDDGDYGGLTSDDSEDEEPSSLPSDSKFDEDEEDVKPDFNDEEEDDDVEKDLERLDELLKDVKREPSSREASPGNAKPVVDEKVKTEPASDTVAWDSDKALMIFRKSAATIAEEYLKNTLNVKTKKSRKRTYSVKDSELYKKGQRDSKKIDLKRRHVEDI